jgi:cytochrome c556
MRRRHLFTGILFASLAISATIAGVSHAQSPAEAVAARQQFMKDNGSAVFRTIRPFVQNGTGNMPDIVKAAEVLTSHNGKYKTLWPKGTEMGVAGSKSKPELWTQTALFDQRVADIEEKSTAMLAAARSGDAAQIRTAFAGVTASCNACHDAFQVR